LCFKGFHNNKINSINRRGTGGDRGGRNDEEKETGRRNDARGRKRGLTTEISEGEILHGHLNSST
jgi:hypothetical protein